MNKEDLLIEESKRDLSFFTQIYDKYFEQIYKYVYRRVFDQLVAEDLVSQTFHDALAYIKKYENRSYPFSSWLYKIAHNNVLKWYKVNSKNKNIDLEKINILGVLEELELQEKELIRLKYFEDVSNLEIAQIMGINSDNVGVKLYRALKKFKELMKY